MSEATKRNLRPDSLTLIQLDDLETAVINNDFIVKEHLLAAIRMARTLRGQASPPEALRRDVPPEIFDSMAVYMELHIEKNEMIKPSMVADVLDALMRLIRKRWKAEAAESPLLEKP